MSQTPDQVEPNAHVHPVFRSILNDVAARLNPTTQKALHSEMQAIADQVMAKHRARVAALPPLPALPLETADQKRARLEAELAAAREGFDPNFEYSEDYGFWAEQSNKARTISACLNQLKGMA